MRRHQKDMLLAAGCWSKGDNMWKQAYSLYLLPIAIPILWYVFTMYEIASLDGYAHLYPYIHIYIFRSRQTKTKVVMMMMILVPTYVCPTRLLNLLRWVNGYWNYTGAHSSISFIRSLLCPDTYYNYYHPIILLDFFNL